MIYACPTPTPTNTPTATPSPSPGYCGGAINWSGFPTTGCATGFAAIGGNYCDRSSIYQNNCYNYGGYNWDTCNCIAGDYGCEAPLGGCGSFDEFLWDSETCDCVPTITPIIVDVDGDGYQMTNANDGVLFDMVGMDGVPEHISWTAAGTDEAFLGLDNNNNGQVDNGTELFGNFTAQPPPPAGVERNGFLALAEFDKQTVGGNDDGLITANDAVFGSLRLWQDLNHNGLSESAELHTLAELGLVSIDLKYRESRRIDEYGNKFRYRGKVKDIHGTQLARWAWDVFLVRRPY